MKILHVITGLNVGGAEMQLCGLCEGLQLKGYEQKVISLLAKGPLSQRLAERGIECAHLGLRQDSPDASGLGTLRRTIREYQPDLVHSWMYHACLYTSVASTFLSHAVPNLWSIHYSSLGFRGNSLSTISAVKACRVFSHRTRVHIAYCAQAAKDAHESRGYCQDRALFLPNGYDPASFSFVPEEREVIRGELGIGGDTTVFGIVARFDPIKDHATFLEAAARARRESSQKLAFVLIGDGINQSNADLMQLLERYSLEGAVILAGRRRDMQSVYSAIDFLTLSSRGEAFPNVLCEAMLCQKPCISTDVGDCRSIVAATGYVVPPGSSQMMGDAMLEAARWTDGERAARGMAARNHIVSHFSSELFLQRHIVLYEQLCSTPDTRVR